MGEVPATSLSTFAKQILTVQNLLEIPEPPTIQTNEVHLVKDHLSSVLKDITLIEDNSGVRMVKNSILKKGYRQL